MHLEVPQVDNELMGNGSINTTEKNRIMVLQDQPKEMVIHQSPHGLLITHISNVSRLSFV